MHWTNFILIFLGMIIIGIWGIMIIASKTGLIDKIESTEKDNKKKKDR